MTNNKKEEIIQKIKDKGYEILEEKDVQFTEEMVREFYKHQEGSVNINLKKSFKKEHSI
jgi:nucleoside diphosphate kinase